MYVDAYYDKKADKIRICERIDGKRVLRTEKPEHYFYLSDNNGDYTGLDGKSCKRYDFPSLSKMESERKSTYKQVYESDISPLNKTLNKLYKDAPAPTLNIAFFDIEVGFDPNKGYAPYDDPFAEITAISVYKKWEQKLETFVLRPPTLTWEEASGIVSKFSNTKLYDDEKQLLLDFCDTIADLDILSGWNCLNKNSEIWLEDRIIKLEDCVAGQKTYAGNDILEYHDSGYKLENKLKLSNGTIISISDEHRIPVCFRENESYKYPSSLLKTQTDLTVGEIKNRMKNEIFYMEVTAHKNINPDMTWKKLLLEYWKEISNTGIDVIISDYELIKEIIERIKNDNALDKVFNRKEYYQGKTPFKRGNAWSYKVLKEYGYVNEDDLIRQLNSSDIQIMRSSSKRKNSGTKFTLNISNKIDPQFMQLIGIIFTDGFWSNYDKCWSMCNTDEGIITGYTEIINNLIGKTIKWYKQSKYRETGKCTKFSENHLNILKFLFYNDNVKQLNVNAFSRFSENQIDHFFAGLIDGDGSNVSIALSVCNFENQISNMSQIMQWNGFFVNEQANAISCPVTLNINRDLNDIRLLLKHSIKRNKEFTLQSRGLSTPTKKGKYVVCDNVILVRIDEIIETGKMIEMADISTSNHYFGCKGYRVHNSTGFDIPYVVNRIKRIINKSATSKLCLWGLEPRRREYVKFKKEHYTYDLFGMVHLDYMELYQKHNTQQLHSYRLEAVAEHEVGDHKTQYEGSLDQLYKNDFPTFIEYNRQDTILLEKIDEKKRFIELANQIAHANTVNLKTTMGSVALVEQAIINQAHDMGRVVLDSKNTYKDRNQDQYDYSTVDDDDDDDNKPYTGHLPVVGAFVLPPKPGIHEEVGCCDINSLYPSAIRTFNMSPETLYGQFKPTYTDAFIRKRITEGWKPAEAWDGLFACLEYTFIMDKTEDVIELELSDGNKISAPAHEFYDIIFNPESNLVISANATLFKTDVKGVIPSLLERWYAERKSMQAKKHEFETLLLTETDPDKIKEYKEMEIFWDSRQQTRKILLNSLYGSLLNPGLRFYDSRLGQSVTLTGRSIVKHMNAKLNENITGVYDHNGEAIIAIDTDSVDGSTLVDTSYGRITIEKFFDMCSIKWNHGDKEYSVDNKVRVLTYNPDMKKAFYENIDYIYRHKVSKEKWMITDITGKEVIVTGDHSVMIYRSGVFMEAKPADILETDSLIVFSHAALESKILKIEMLDDFFEEYVYDIGIYGDTPYFFGNDILVHNSAYFSVLPMMKDVPRPSKEAIIELYDELSEATNATFPKFLHEKFNVSLEQGKIIKAGRELVASRALFIKKKKYAALVYDKEGIRLDINGSPGKPKIMGLDLKRSDTPKFMQAFLEEILMDVLVGENEAFILPKIKDFRKEFKKRPGWEKGSPKKVNGLTDYSVKEKTSKSLGLDEIRDYKKTGRKVKVNIPGHVRASMNWNTLRKMHNDNYSVEIMDGAKVIVCKLLSNAMGMSSVAYPVDEPHLPQWFKDLPFDHNAMEDIIIDFKVKNMLGVLKWDLGKSKETFDDIFKFKF